ncbi:uncharacterized protein DMENIID0001_019290 [Sergentomyia squamirostris]
MIPLMILEEGSYEKDVLLYVNLGEPQMVGERSWAGRVAERLWPGTRKMSGFTQYELATLVQEAEAKAPEDLTEEDKMALLGRPKAGDVVRAQIRIKESKEFKPVLQGSFSRCVFLEDFLEDVFFFLGSE